MNNRAFTLLELLIVITIIGILSSIVIVSMSGSTDSATIAKGKAYAQQIHALLGHEAVLDLNFNENNYNACPDGSDVCDASGYNNNGTIYNNEAIYISSPVDGYALIFDGENDYINCGNKSSLRPNQITVEAWAKRLSEEEGGEVVVAYGWSGSVAEGYKLYSTSNKIRFLIYCETGSDITTTEIDWISNEWLHLVGTYDGSRKKVYLNGVEIQNISKSIGNITYPNIRSVGVGAQDLDVSPESFFNGLIDDVRIYSVALPSTEIQKHYVQGLERFLANQTITQVEYDQRMEEFNQYLASNRF
jgi:prepilin-type N-terminal cleavage/methylation domain-containing protein